jgi:hypothetical protein
MFNEHSRTNLIGSVLRKKGEKEEIEKQLEENGTLTDYLKDKKPVERYDETEVKLNWSNLF